MRRILAAFLLVVLFESGCKKREEVVTPVAAPEEEVVVAPAAESIGEGEQVFFRNPGNWLVSASSTEEGFAPNLAVDGSEATRWSSAFADGQWWEVQFGQEHVLGKVVVNWEAAYARKYRVLVLNRSNEWVEVLAKSNGQGGSEEIEFARHRAWGLRIECQERATQWGFSIREVVFNPREPMKTEAMSSSGSGDYEPKFAIDGKMDTRWSSNFGDEEWWQVRFENPRTICGLKINWETAFAEKYEIAVSMDGNDWKKVYDVTEGDGRTDLLFFKPVETRFVRIQCRQRGTGWGNSIYEVKFFDDLSQPELTSSSDAADSYAWQAMDGDLATAWRSNGDGDQQVVVSLPEVMNIGGVLISWAGDHATRYELETSVDGSAWKPAFKEASGNGGKDYVFFGATDAKYLRMLMKKSSGGQGYALAEVEFKGGEEQATPLRSYQAVALGAKPGRHMMWLTRQQEFWTVVGMPDDTQETLIGETGVIEPRKNDFSVQPFVRLGDELVTWADVKLEQSLEQDHLPVPSVRWKGRGWTLDISPVAFGATGQVCTAVRYRFTNTGATPLAGQVALAVRPVSLNPVWQHGGFSAIPEAEAVLDAAPAFLSVGGKARMISLTKPADAGVAALGDGEVADFIAAGAAPKAKKASEPEGKVGAAFLYDVAVDAGGTKDIIVAYLLHDASKVPQELVADPAGEFERLRTANVAMWADLLKWPAISIPEKRLVNVMKSNVGYVLINRDAPWFKPGSRNYDHSWMRDGALTGVAMLRMARPELVRQFIEGFNGFVGDNGWVPFLILENGSPNTFNANLEGGEGHEYDSQGQFPFIVRQYYDFTGDRALVERVYPKVVKSLEFARMLRALRMTDEYKNDPKKRDYYGVVPASNSHEGYFPAKHSYWDDLWIIKGLRDGAYLASVLGHTNDAAWMAAEAEDLRKCTYESMISVAKRVGINQLPGCVELGDLDATSTSIGVMACDETDFMPQPWLNNTFDNYYNHISKRFRGEKDTFTPYEARNADVFTRLGQRDRALALLRYLANDSARPFGWNHLAEVVHAKERAPSYIGDMPHTWCGSDLISAIRTVFAYEIGERLTLAAGVDPAWLNEGVTVKNLATQFGLVDYTFKREGNEILFSASGAAKPPQGFVLPLPESLLGLSVEVNGKPVEIQDGEVKFDAVPATVRLFTPAPEPVAAPAASAPAPAATP